MFPPNDDISNTNTIQNARIQPPSRYPDMEEEYAFNLDILMVVVFEHFEWCFKDSHESFSESVFRSLVASFETTLMQTHNAKYPHFFDVCSI
jgi:hypothetical protein